MCRSIGGNTGGRHTCSTSNHSKAAAPDSPSSSMSITGLVLDGGGMPPCVELSPLRTEPSPARPRSISGADSIQGGEGRSPVWKSVKAVVTEDAAWVTRLETTGAGNAADSCEGGALIAFVPAATSPTPCRTKSGGPGHAAAVPAFPRKASNGSASSRPFLPPNHSSAWDDMRCQPYEGGQRSGSRRSEVQRSCCITEINYWNTEANPGTLVWMRFYLLGGKKKT